VAHVELVSFMSEMPGMLSHLVTHTVKADMVTVRSMTIMMSSMKFMMTALMCVYFSFTALLLGSMVMMRTMMYHFFRSRTENWKEATASNEENSKRNG